MEEPPEWVVRPPATYTSLVGRRREHAAVRALLTPSPVRLVTVTGPGGVGKTRLAVDVVTELDSGFEVLAFVALGSVSEPGLVETTIAGTFGIDAPDGEALRTRLRQRPALLFLDNFEHLLEAGPVLAGLLADCPQLTLLVTSRARLRLAAEHVVALAPLPLRDAVRLFAERAKAASAEFTLHDGNAADVERTCCRLDGLPLAIELAAARINVLPPATMFARLDRRLPVLTDGPPERPERLRTMRAAIGWSYDLLSAAEQTLVRRLGVFAGSCTLAAAESVGGHDAFDLIGGLVDKSLLHQVTDAHGEPRFAMLDTIREYAVEQLVLSDEEEAVRRAHAGHLREFAEVAGPGLRGAEQGRWRDALDACLPDLRAALGWALRDAAGAADVENGLRLAGALWFFWFQRGLVDEGRRWLTRALGHEQARGPSRAQVLLGAGTLAWRQGDCGTAAAHLAESLPLWRELADGSGLAETLHVLGHIRFDQRDYQAARRLFTESRGEYQLSGDTLGGLPLIGDLGLVAYHEGDYATAEVIWRDSLVLYRHHGLVDRVAGALNGLGDLARLAGAADRATALYEESLALWRDLRGAPGIASALHKLGQVRRSAPDARARFVESLALQQELGNKQGIAEGLAALAGMAVDAGSPRLAVRLFAAASRLLEATGVPLAPADQEVLTRDLGTTRGQLGPADWQAAWANGAELPVEHAVALATSTDDIGEPVVHRLSPREREVGALIAGGLTNRQISKALSISEKTVSSHIEHIMNKLDVRSRTRIAVWAVANGLGPSE